MKVARPLWKTFTSHLLLGTPQEESLRLFTSSEPINELKGTFSANVLRMLRASLSLDPKLSSIEIMAVKGGDTGLDARYTSSERLLRIHGKLNGLISARPMRSALATCQSSKGIGWWKQMSSPATILWKIFFS